MMEEALNLAREWDKTFPQSDKVDRRKVTFRSRYGITLAADLYQPILCYAHEIRSAVLIVHGEKAHSRYFGEDAFQKLTGDNKELLIIPGAVHTDLYDGGGKDAIPFDKLEQFFAENLK